MVKIQFRNCWWQLLHDFTRPSKVLFIWFILLLFIASFNSNELRLYCRICFSKPDALRQISELASEPLDVEASLPTGNRSRILSDHLTWKSTNSTDALKSPERISWFSFFIFVPESSLDYFSYKKPWTRLEKVLKLYKAYQEHVRTHRTLQGIV